MVQLTALNGGLTAVLTAPLSGWAVFAGVVLGLGLCSIASVAPTFGRPRLLDRIAPYLVDVSQGARERVDQTQREPMASLGALRSAMASLLGGGSAITLRLRQSGSALSVDGYRSRQLAWALGGAALGGAIAMLLGFTRDLAHPVQIGIVVSAALAGARLRDRVLARAARARLNRMTSELPCVLEFITLSLSAGESVLDAFRRVARVGRGELAQELTGVLRSVATGRAFGDELTNLARELQLTAFTRCVEQITGALERGTPVAEVLRAQVQDARSEATRTLLELAGTKETTMLVPLVFLILPVTILFATFPGFFFLRLGF